MDNIEKANQGKFFSCFINYHPIFNPNSTLRRQIKLDVLYDSPAMATDKLTLSSFLRQASGQEPEVPLVACVTPVEIAADKLCALSWRVLIRERGAKKDDPAIVRHLYDLVALEDCAKQSSDFPELLSQLLNREQGRLEKLPEIYLMAPHSRLLKALDMLAEDPEYPGEYQHFALRMSYAPEAKRPSFEQTLKAARRLAERVA